MNLDLKHAPKDLLKVRSQLFLECGEVGRVGDYWEGIDYCQHDLEMNLEPFLYLFSPLVIRHQFCSFMLCIAGLEQQHLVGMGCNF